MSVLNKMSIQGIRSFGPDEKDIQMFKFQSPLTLILGQNGTGKTTIIECLRYITTGDTPPNTGQGRCFVLDPKVAKSSEVFAQVKLQFSDSVGNKVTVTRSSKVTQKQSKIQFQSLESSISRSDGNTTKALSSKCADVNAEMINLLGVSKPVLANVIFCHQEDSNWPLSEGKLLKTKFDDIFAATRYAKALKQIREEKKTLSNSVDVFKTEIPYLKNFRDIAEKKKKVLSCKNATLSEYEKEMQDIEENLIPIKESLEKLKENENHINEVKNEIETRKARLNELNDVIEDMKRSLSEIFKGTDDELNLQINEFDQQVQEQKKSLSRLQIKIMNLGERLRTKEKTIETLLIEQGKLESEEKIHKDNISYRLKMLKDIGKKHNILLFNDASKNCENVIDEQIQELKNYLEKFSQEMSEIKKKHDESENKVQNSIDEFRDQKSKLEQIQKLRKDQIKSKQEEIKKLTEKIDEIEAAIAMNNHINEELESLEFKLKQHEKSLDSEATEEQIANLKNEEKNFQNELQKLRKEATIINHQTANRTKLNCLKKDKINKESLIKNINSKYKDDLMNTIGYIPNENAKSKISVYLSSVTSEMKRMQDDLNSFHKQLSTVEANQETSLDQLTTLKQQFSNKKEQLTKACGNRSFSNELKSLEQSISVLQNDKGAMTGSQILRESYVKKLQMCPSCPLCKRQFEDQDDVEKLIKDLKAVILSLPSMIEEKSNLLVTQQKRYEDLLQLQPVEEMMEKLSSKEIPELEKKIDSYEEQIKSLKKKIEESNKLYSECLTRKNTAESMHVDMGLLDQHQADLKKFNEMIEKLNNEGIKDDNRTVEKIDKQCQDIDLQLNLKRNYIEHLNKQINDHHKISNDIKSEINDMKEERQKSSEDSSQISLLQESNTKLRFEIENFRSEIQVDDDKLNSINLKLQELNNVKSKKIKEIRIVFDQCAAKKQELTNSFNDIKKLDYEIKSYIKNEKENIFLEKKSTLAYEQSEIKDINSQIVIVQTKIDELKEKLNKQEIDQRELKDNRTLRIKQSNISLLNKEIITFKQQLDEISVEDFEREQIKMSKRYMKLSNRFQECSGERNELKKSIEGLEKELENKELKSADENFKNKMIELKTTEMAVEDLDKYHKALDAALNKYHSIKMAEVNKLIKELWQLTYRGNDIDYIQINCGDETSGKSGKRLVYDYRVILVKADTSLDMRGRCSAGQKVLASLIIRLALAETFCLYCGILCLDEPTTNLDRANIDSLAEALGKIVDARSDQKNFQLVIITHDEEFIDLLSRSTSTDTYLKVEKSEEGYSRIDKYSL